MADRVKGISIEIDGNTSKLSQSLEEVNRAIRKSNTELNDLKRLLKLDPGNTELIAQKQTVLKNAIEATADKLKQLKLAQGDVDRAFQSGKIDEKKYRDFKKEVAETETKLDGLEKELKETGKELKNHGKNTDEASKSTSVFGEVLKANLTSEVIVAGVKKIASAMAEIGKMVVGVVKASVEAFAQYEQVVGGVETLFGKSSDMVIKNAEKAYKTAGVSANKYMEQATSFSATLLQGLGGDTKKAAEYADKAIIAMGDNANKMGTSVDMIQNAYQGFAKDNFTMLDNLKLGYGGTAGEMARLINDTGVMGKGFKATAQNVKDISFDKMIDAISKVQDELGITGTTALEASETIQGSLGSVKASWENVLVAFTQGGDSLKTALGGLMEGVGNLIDNVMAIIPTVLESIIDAGFMIIDKIPEIIDKILPIIVEAMPRFITAGVELIKALVQGLQGNMPEIIGAVIEIIGTLVQGLIEMLPDILDMGITILLELITGLTKTIPDLIPVMVDTMITLVDTLLDNLDLIIDAGIELIIALALGLVDALPKIVEKIPIIIDKLVQTIFKNLPKLIEAGIQLIVQLAVGLVKAIPNLLSALPKLFKSLMDGLTTWSKKMPEVGLNLIKGLWNGISNAAQWLKNKISGWVDDVVGAIKDFFGIHSPSKVMEDEIGENLGLGVAKGIENSIGMVQGAMKHLSAKVTTSVNPTINPMANSNPLYLQIENFNNTRDTDVQALMVEAEFYRRNRAIAVGGA